MLLMACAIATYWHSRCLITCGDRFQKSTWISCDNLTSYEFFHYYLSSTSTRWKATSFHCYRSGDVSIGFICFNHLPLAGNFVFARYINDIESFGQFIWRMLVIYVQTLRRQCLQSQWLRPHGYNLLAKKSTNKRFYIFLGWFAIWEDRSLH